MRSEIRRITDLFQEGTEVVLRDAPDAVLVWVQKLNPFERQECNSDGQAARARLILALQEPESPEATLFRSSLHKVTDEQLREAIIRSFWNEDLTRAVDDIRASEDWTEKLDMLSRSDEQLADREPDDPEVQAVGKARRDYFDAINQRTDELQSDRKEDLAGAKRKELVDTYEERWIDSRGSGAFTEAFRMTEVFYALRECQATSRDGNGRWQHDQCDHSRKWLDGRNEVRSLPDGLIGKVREAIDGLSMSPGEAKNSDRPGSSSESSPAQSEAAVSTASTPEETSPELVGTSASQ